MSRQDIISLSTLSQTEDHDLNLPQISHMGCLTHHDHGVSFEFGI